MTTNDVERLRARDNKQAILAAETESDRWRRTLAEKVETITRLRGLARPDAEREAFKHVLIKYLNDTHPNTDPTRCAHCGDPETPDATLQPIGSICVTAITAHSRGCSKITDCRRSRLLERTGNPIVGNGIQADVA